MIEAGSEVRGVWRRRSGCTGTETSLSPWHRTTPCNTKPYDARLDVLVDQQVAEVLADLL